MDDFEMVASIGAGVWFIGGAAVGLVAGLAASQVLLIGAGPVVIGAAAFHFVKQSRGGF